MSGQGEKESVGDVSEAAVMLSAQHMAWVITNVVGEMLAYVPEQQRQQYFLLIGASAHRSANNVVGKAPETLKRQVVSTSVALVDAALKRVADSYGLKLPPDIERERAQTRN